MPAAGADAQLFDLAKKVANPIADLATAPLLYNWDGLGRGFRFEATLVFPDGP